MLVPFILYFVFLFLFLFLILFWLFSLVIIIISSQFQWIIHVSTSLLSESMELWRAAR